jgi:hypothetical protein
MMKLMQALSGPDDVVRPGGSQKTQAGEACWSTALVCNTGNRT